MTAARRSILIVGPAWVGDMVMAQSLFTTLTRLHPGGLQIPGGLHIDVLAPAWSLPLLACMPEVRHGIPLPVRHGELALRQRWTLGRQLRTGGYDQAIVLPRSFKSALPPWVARIPQRTGYRGEFRYGLLNDIRPLDRSRLYRTVDRFVNLGLPPGTPLPAEIPEPLLRLPANGPRETAAAFGLDSNRGPLVALCPGAEYGAAKRWPEEQFAATAQACVQRGYQVCLLGSERDQPVTRAIAEHCPGTHDLAGKTSLIQAANLLAQARWVVTNDSGLMHVAAAVGASVIALYGSSDPAFTPPLSARATVLSKGLACSPCFRRDCPLTHLHCLRLISVAEVLAVIDGNS